MYFREIRKTGSRKHFLIWMAVLCMVLACGSPALAKCSKKSKKSSKSTAGAPPVMSSSRGEWTNGTWVNGCYVNGQGKVLASMAEADQAHVPAMRKLKKYHILFLGASQTTRTAAAVRDKGVYFYGCGGARFDWFFQKQHKSKGRMYQPAYLVIRSYLKQRPTGTVVVDMGGNDIENLDAYIGFYRDLVNKYPEATFFFRGVPPRGESYSWCNDKRREFNRRLESALPGHVINLFDRILAFPDFKTLDGVHYAKPMTRRIYQLTMDGMGRRVTVNTKTGKVTAAK